eukprot:CAMPEP_0172639356 /NCGR_PEP_ID=MMETSP1068-20121228/218195_1 /TAXON_ID=35684 /ORGANISM="Pseudopedinella elastica, Strain CCMP716" /LENGTH=123 /DNA_ID=CAMNT_0013452477 /DNA_START=238 /DNA_END=610 /DNA_ORIENTATION=+
MHFPLRRNPRVRRMQLGDHRHQSVRQEASPCSRPRTPAGPPPTEGPHPTEGHPPTARRDSTQKLDPVSTGNQLGATSPFVDLCAAAARAPQMPDELGVVLAKHLQHARPPRQEIGVGLGSPVE